MPLHQTRRDKLNQSLILVSISSAFAAALILGMSLTILARSPARPVIMAVGGVEFLFAAALAVYRDKIVESVLKKEGRTEEKNGR